MFRFALVILCTLAGVAGPATAAAEERLAVLEFTGAQAPPELLRALTERARGASLAPARERGITVMTREAIALVLKEMGGKCDEGECEIEVARSVGASIVVTGEVRQLSGTWLLDLKLHETKKGSLLSVESVPAATDVALLDATGAATQRLLGGVAGGKLDTSALLRIDVDQPGAVVAVDGGQVGTSPLTTPARVEAGKRTLSVIKEGFLPYQTVLALKPGAEVALSVRLLPATAAAPAQGPWYLEGRVAVASPSGFETTGVSDAFVSIGGSVVPWGSIRVGRQVGESASVEAVAGYTDLKQDSVSGSGYVNPKGVTAGAAIAWSPPEYKWLAFAFEAGAWLRSGSISTPTSTAGGRSSTAMDGTGPYAGGELRLDVPASGSWVLGIRAGVAVFDGGPAVTATGIDPRSGAPLTHAFAGGAFLLLHGGVSMRVRI